MAMQLNRSYLFKDQAAPKFNATLTAAGLYNTNQFVLRLSPIIHHKLSQMTAGITTSNTIGFDGAQAMSTFLHETIHWWQHIGSTYGFIFNLNYPIQSHATYFQLKHILQAGGFKKSITKQAEILNLHGPTGFGTPAGTANIIVNNHFDLLAFRAFTLGPEAAKHVVQQPLFEAVGHAFHMTYAHTVNILGSSVDRDFSALPHPKEWEEGFRALSVEKVRGYFYGSSVGIWPLGSYEIFEGQARFCQIQYLSHACGHKLTWDDYRNIGMLNGIYVRAFEEFLNLLEVNWPAQVNDPLVGLFLLICDLSINPGSGFPFHISPNFETFIEDTNPGARFCIFSRIAAKKDLTRKKPILKFSKTEYEEICDELCHTAKEYTPMQISSVFVNWFSNYGALKKLREEYETYSFHPENYALRHLFSHFLALQEDKQKRPEFFCWPGAWLAGKNVSEREQTLFEKHGALFVDREDHDGVFARLQPGRSELSVQSAFETFYQNTVIYDLIDQWIGKPGRFRYDLAWLKPDASASEMQDFLRKKFTLAFGADPESAQILP